MAETRNPQEWDISPTPAPQVTNVIEPIGNEWNIGQPAAAPTQSIATQQTNQQWNLEVEQWKVNQPEPAKQNQMETKKNQEVYEQWNMSETAAHLESSPEQPSSDWGVSSRQPEPQPSNSSEPITQKCGIEQQVVPSSPSAPSQAAAEKQEPVKEQKEAPHSRPVMTSEDKPVASSVKDPVVNTKPDVPQTAVEQSTTQQEPVAPKQTAPSPVMSAQPNASHATVTQSHQQQTAPKQTAVQQITPQKTTQTRTVVQSTTKISMQPKISHQSGSQRTQQSRIPQPVVAKETVAKATPAPASIPPEVKPKPPSPDNQSRRSGEEGSLEELQKGVFSIGPDLEGWVDKTKALKEEFRRQSIANEMYFVKNLPRLDVKALNISVDPAKYVYDIKNLKGAEVVNLLRCVIIEYREFEAGPFLFQFGEDKKFKLELLPTATQPGNGLIKSVGRLKYYTYPDMCQMLKTAGVTSKGLGIMLQKLNTSGLKSALNNKISPMNELHFMLLFEVARRLVRGPHGHSMSSEPEIDQLPIGVAVSRMIAMFCRGNYCLNYEAVFGPQDKYNPFIDTSVVLRRQKIYSLNKLYYDAEIRSQASENPFLAKFLKYHNGYVIKTVNGFMEELDMSYKGF